MKRQQHHSVNEQTPVSEGKRELILQGHETNFYTSGDPDSLIQEFKSNGQTNGKRTTKRNPVAMMRSAISSYLFEHLDGFHIPTHFLKRLSENEVLVRRLDMIPIVVKAYNYSVGTIPERFGIPEGAPLEFPIFEYFFRASNQEATWVNEHHLYALGIATPDECKQINRLTSKVNAVLRALCSRRRLTLIEMSLEFGRYKGQIYLGDDLSPRTCLFGELTPAREVNIHRFLPNGVQAETLYTELLDRLSLKV